jgi:hypothetical protein
MHVMVAPPADPAPPIGPACRRCSDGDEADGDAFVAGPAALPLPP